MTLTEEARKILDGLVDRWHEGAGEGLGLREFLGLAPAEYQEFVHARGSPEPSTPPGDEMTAGEKLELDKLLQKHQERLAEDGGVWPEYTGDGT